MLCNPGGYMIFLIFQRVHLIFFLWCLCYTTLTPHSLYSKTDDCSVLIKQIENWNNKQTIDTETYDQIRKSYENNKYGKEEKCAFYFGQFFYEKKILNDAKKYLNISKNVINSGDAKFFPMYTMLLNIAIKEKNFNDAIKYFTKVRNGFNQTEKTTNKNLICELANESILNYFKNPYYSLNQKGKKYPKDELEFCNIHPNKTSIKIIKQSLEAYDDLVVIDNHRMNHKMVNEIVKQLTQVKEQNNNIVGIENSLTKYKKYQLIHNTIKSGLTLESKNQFSGEDNACKKFTETIKLLAQSGIEGSTLNTFSQCHKKQACLIEQIERIQNEFQPTFNNDLQPQTIKTYKTLIVRRLKEIDRTMRNGCEQVKIIKSTKNDLIDLNNFYTTLIELKENENVTSMVQLFNRYSTQNKQRWKNIIGAEIENYYYKKLKSQLLQTNTHQEFRNAFSSIISEYEKYDEYRNNWNQLRNREGIDYYAQYKNLGELISSITNRQTRDQVLAKCDNVNNDIITQWQLRRNCTRRAPFTPNIYQESQAPGINYLDENTCWKPFTEYKYQEARDCCEIHIRAIPNSMPNFNNHYNNVVERISVLNDFISYKNEIKSKYNFVCNQDTLNQVENEITSFFNYNGKFGNAHFLYPHRSPVNNHRYHFKVIKLLEFAKCLLKNENYKEAENTIGTITNLYRNYLNEEDKSQLVILNSELETIKQSESIDINFETIADAKRILNTFKNDKNRSTSKRTKITNFLNMILAKMPIVNNEEKKEYYGIYLQLRPFLDKNEWKSFDILFGPFIKSIE